MLTICSFEPTLSYIGRRSAYLWECAGLTIILFLIGAIDIAPRGTKAPVWVQCSLMLLANFVYDISIDPFCFALLAEVFSAKLRGLTIALATVSVDVVFIVSAVATPHAINVDQSNWREKIGFLFAGLSFLCTLYCFSCLPETRGRTLCLSTRFQAGIPKITR